MSAVLPPRSRFLTLLAEAVARGALVKLTLGKPRREAADPTLKNVFVRPVSLNAGPRLSFVYRHDTRDVTKNIAPEAATELVTRLLAESFLDAHLFLDDGVGRLEQSDRAGRPDRFKLEPVGAARATPAGDHDRAKTRVVDAEATWLRALGVTNERGQPREGMAHKFRQIEKFSELVRGLLHEAGLTDAPSAAPGSGQRLRIADMGAGKGYLTFALAALLGEETMTIGIERRPELVALCNRIASETGFASRLRFLEGDIPTRPLPSPPAAGNAAAADDVAAALVGLDVLIALHACDTATDDALAAGHASGARLLVVSPCCQKELRPQLSSPPVLADALRHGIFQERQAEFVTDALRAQLLECVGYRTKVFEFVSTEHTAKNLLLVAMRPPVVADRAESPPCPATVARTRAFAAFYGIRRHRLADHLGIQLAP